MPSLIERTKDKLDSWNPTYVVYLNGEWVECRVHLLSSVANGLNPEQKMTDRLVCFIFSDGLTKWIKNPEVFKISLNDHSLDWINK